MPRGAHVQSTYEPRRIREQDGRPAGEYRNPTSTSPPQTCAETPSQKTKMVEAGNTPLQTLRISTQNVSQYLNNSTNDTLHDILARGITNLETRVDPQLHFVENLTTTTTTLLCKKQARSEVKIAVKVLTQQGGAYRSALHVSLHLLSSSTRPPPPRLPLPPSPPPALPCFPSRGHNIRDKHGFRAFTKTPVVFALRG